MTRRQHTVLKTRRSLCCQTDVLFFMYSVVVDFKYVRKFIDHRILSVRRSFIVFQQKDTTSLTPAYLPIYLSIRPSLKGLRESATEFILLKNLLTQSCSTNDNWDGKIDDVRVHYTCFLILQKLCSRQSSKKDTSIIA